MNDSSWRGRLAADAYERREARLQPGEIGIVRGQRSLELRLRLLRRIGLEDAALRLHDLPQRPEGDPVSVREAATLPPGHEPGPLFDVGKELCGEATLSDARLPHDRHELARALLRCTFEGADQERLLELPPDQGSRMRSGDVGAEACTGVQRPVERQAARALPFTWTGASSS